MKRRMRFALWLYPPAWRDRYAREFTALLEDVHCGWREFWDVARGGLTMRLLRWNLANVTAACALLGAAIGGGWSLRVPDLYVSTSVFRLTGDAKVEDLQRVQTEVFSRGSLTAMIVAQDLYRDERMSMPMEDVISDVRNKHIRVIPLAARADNPRSPSAFAINFEHPDRVKAREFNRAVADRFTAALPSIQVLDPPTVPDRPSYPNRLSFTLIGLAAGLAAGILAVGVRRWPIVAVSGAAAAAAALAISYAIPDRWQSTAVLSIDPATPGLIEAALDDAVLQRIIENPSLNLYANERKSRPIADVVRQMRERDLHVLQIHVGDKPAIAVTFQHTGSRYKAQAVAREFLTVLTDANVARARQFVQRLTVVTPATLPESPIAPNRLAIRAAGLTAGLAAGAIVTRKRCLRTTAA